MIDFLFHTLERSGINFVLGRDEIENGLEGLGFHFCRRSGLYCLGNPAEKIPRAILDDSAPGILTIEQVAELLSVTREEDPGMLAYVAIGLFAGLRRSELCSLEWSEIDLKARTNVYAYMCPLVTEHQGCATEWTES